MRDEMDARMWNAHHDQFSEWVDSGVAAAAARLRKLGTLAFRVPGQLLAAVAAVGLTLLTFGASGA